MVVENPQRLLRLFGGTQRSHSLIVEMTMSYWLRWNEDCTEPFLRKLKTGLPWMKLTRKELSVCPNKAYL